MAINFQDHWDRATTNSKHYFQNFGATVHKGAKISSEHVAADDITFGAPVNNNYLGLVAKVQDSFLSERLFDLKPATRELRSASAESAAADAEAPARTEEVGHYLKTADGAMLEKPFIAVMNWSDKIGTLLANATFKLTPTKAIGNLAAISAIHAAVLRAAALIVGAAICAGIIAPLEFLAVLAVKSKEGLVYVGRKIAQTAPFILTGLAAAGAIAWKGMQITGQAIAKGAVLTAIGLQKTAKALAYLIAHIAVIATVSVIDLLQFSFKALGWVWSTITGVRQLAEDNKQTQKLLAEALGRHIPETKTNMDRSWIVGYIRRCAEHGFEGSLHSYASSISGRAADASALVKGDEGSKPRSSSLESLSSAEEADEAALNPFAAQKGPTIAVKRSPLELGGVDLTLDSTYSVEGADERLMPHVPTGKKEKVNPRTLRSLETFKCENPLARTRA